MESSWSNGKAAYRCRHGHPPAAAPGPDQPRNAYVREDRILAQLPALHLVLTGARPSRRRRTRRGTDARAAASPRQAIGYLREQSITLTWDQSTGTLRGRPALAAARARVTSRHACPDKADHGVLTCPSPTRTLRT